MATGQTMNIAEYRSLVERVMRDAAAGSNAVPVFENFGTEHARVVIDTMLRQAQNSVLVYSENLNNGAFDAALIRDLLKRNPNAKILVLVESADRGPQSALTALDDLIKNGHVKVLPTVARSQHLTIVDGRHVRVETDHSARKAVVAFGNDSLAQRATTLFSTLWAKAGGNSNDVAEAAIAAGETV